MKPHYQMTLNDQPGTEPWVEFYTKLDDDNIYFWHTNLPLERRWTWDDITAAEERAAAYFTELREELRPRARVGRGDA